MESDKFAEILRKINKEITITNQFESAVNENGERKYGQKKDRWWDESTGSQKEHVICWFSRKYHDGSTQKCIDSNFPSTCTQCYFADKDKKEKPEGFGKEQDAQKIFNKMRRPEMYIYIAEALDVFSEEELNTFVDNIKRAIEKNESWKNVINKYLTWDKVEEKAREK